MASARFAWGIDIGNRALKAVKLVREGDGLRVDDFEVIEHETVLSNAGDNKETLIQAALANFAQRHPTKGGVVSAGVSGQSSFARFIKLPPVETKKIPEIVRFEAIQQIPFPLDDVEWSYQLFESPESPDIEVGIFAMRKELVNQHIKYFTDIDMNVQSVQMNPLAVYNALQHDGKFDKGTTMVIDLGAENTDLLIADNNSIWMRSIPIGGNNFTETLVKAFKLNFAKAEDLKRNAATSKYARQIFQAMRPIFADLVAEIQRSIGFYASVHRDSRIKKVIAIGGTFRLPGLQKYLQQNLQMDVERLDNIAAKPPTDPKMVGGFNENLLSIVSAYGLAVQAMDEAKITSSLLPATIRREKMWKEKTKWFGAAAALFWVGAGLAFARYLLNDFQFTGAEATSLSTINETKRKATDLDKRWADIEAAGGPERENIRNSLNLASYHTFWPSLIADIYDTLPASERTAVAMQPAATQPAVPSMSRDKRDRIYIDSILSRFDDGLAAKVTEVDFTRYASLDVTQSPAAASAGDNGLPAAPAPPVPTANGVPAGNGVLKPDSRGFIVVLHCTSPFGNAMMPTGPVFKDFIDRLMAIKPDAKRQHMEYAVARAAVGTRVTRIKDDPARLAVLRQQYQALLKAQAAASPATPAAPAGGDDNSRNAPNDQGRPTNYQAAPPAPPHIQLPPMPNGRPNYSPPPSPQGQPQSGYFPNPGAGQPNVSNAPITASDAEAFKDPVTGESVLNDWEFDIVIAVVLDPPPYDPATVTPPGSATPAGQQASAQ